MAGLTDRQKFYKAHLDAARDQGLTIAAYARANDIPAQSLYAARRRIEGQSDFVRIERVAQPALTRLEMRLPNGLLVVAISDDVTSVLRAAAAL